MITGHDIYNVAVHLNAQYNNEAGQRAQIGRLYYAAFVDVREYCRARGVTFVGTGQDHGIARNALQSVDRRAARAFGKLRQIRNMADYELHHSAAHVAAQLQDADKQIRIVSAALVALGPPVLI